MDAMNINKRAGAVIIAGFVLLFAVAATAEEKFGVPVYPGAEYDEKTSEFLDEVQCLEAVAYRTSESPATVAEFYAKLGFATVKGKAKAHATFRKDDVEVAVIGPPRKDAVSGKKMNDTLITFTKKE
jgi:hypothetical protein